MSLTFWCLPKFESGWGEFWKIFLASYYFGQHDSPSGRPIDWNEIVGSLAWCTTCMLPGCTVQMLHTLLCIPSASLPRYTVYKCCNITTYLLHTLCGQRAVVTGKWELALWSTGIFSETSLLAWVWASWWDDNQWQTEYVILSSWSTKMFVKKSLRIWRWQNTIMTKAPDPIEVVILNSHDGHTVHVSTVSITKINLSTLFVVVSGHNFLEQSGHS